MTLPSHPKEGQCLHHFQPAFQDADIEVVTPGQGDFYEEIVKLAPGCDVGLVIAPDHLLPRFTLAMETSTHNLGCGSMNVAVCANKQQTGTILASHGIAVPEEQEEGLRVVKPVYGCGSTGVRLTRDPAGKGEFGQRYIEGENYSVSVVGSRVVGEACLYFTGEPPVAIALNRQQIEIDPEGKFHYCGGETPVSHPKEQEIRETASQCGEDPRLPGLCRGRRGSCRPGLRRGRKSPHNHEHRGDHCMYERRDCRYPYQGIERNSHRGAPLFGPRQL